MNFRISVGCITFQYTDITTKLNKNAVSKVQCTLASNPAFSFTFLSPAACRQKKKWMIVISKVQFEKVLKKLSNTESPKHKGSATTTDRLSTKKKRKIL